MNRDLFLAILAMDSYNRGYGAKLKELSDDVGQRLGLASITAHTSNDPADSPFQAGFYAIAYDWNGETIISYRGTDGLDDVYNGWTTGLGWTDQKQANLA